MKLVISLMALSFSAMAFAGDNSICNADASGIVIMGSAYAVTIDQSGHEKILDPSKIVSNTTSGNTQTIVTKSKDYNGKDVQMTVILQKENGLVTSVKTVYNGFKVGNTEYKGVEHNFSVDKSGDCQIDQQSMRISKQGKETGLVSYDRQFCEKLAPYMKQMGTSNVGLCSGVMLAAQNAFEARQGQLKKENKDMSTIHYGGSEITNGNGVMNLAVAIQSCGVPDVYKQMLQNPYMHAGMGMMGGGLMAGGGYYYNYPSSQPTTTVPASGAK